MKSGFLVALRSACGATSSLPDALAKVSSQSALRTLAIAHFRRALVEFTHRLASRLGANRMETKLMEVTTVSARFSKSLAGVRTKKGAFDAPRSTFATAAKSLGDWALGSGPFFGCSLRVDGQRGRGL